MWSIFNPILIDLHLKIWISNLILFNLSYNKVTMNNTAESSKIKIGLLPMYMDVFLKGRPEKTPIVKSFIKKNEER